MEANIANLSLEDEEEESIPCEREPNNDDEDRRFCLVGRALIDCVIHFPSLKRTIADLWHPSPSRNKLLAGGIWLKEELPSGIKRGNNSVGMELDGKGRRRIDGEDFSQGDWSIGQREAIMEDTPIKYACRLGAMKILSWNLRGLGHPQVVNRLGNKTWVCKVPKVDCQLDGKKNMKYSCKKGILKPPTEVRELSGYAIDECDLNELEFRGRWFTWERGRLLENNNGSFRFNASWVLEEEYERRIKNFWEGNEEDVCTKLRKLGKRLEELNIMDPDDETFVEMEEVKLALNLEADKEELMWEQAKENWLRFGKLRIVIEYFKKLFTASNTWNDERALSGITKYIQENMNRTLLKDFQMEE
ncbi:hypothetical protein Goari_019512, partial [Gossypium aridum]|nr:hypothetical protein [Gossypium aridum]